MNRVFLALVLLLIAFGAAAQTTNGLSKAEIEGRQLVQEILEQAPTTNFTQTGTLTIRPAKGMTTNVPVVFDTSLETGYWEVIYTVNTNSSEISLMIIRRDGLPNQYSLSKGDNISSGGVEKLTPLHLTPANKLNEAQIMAPFAGSDFWIADLGLEFFHWPGQKILKHEDRRTRACAVLESTNPNPAPGAYSRVVTWIDNESLAIVWAEAYDANSKLLKEFDPKKVKKINGRWELESMEIRNVQTKSRTSIKFDLNSK
ncbi:MAG TPA: outer membrane lipoprotein-sorting protein [Pseudomonadales bacterium]|nr:outer membrane lipoprotein-sorting protein [Pseudomonadales bacterium]